MSSEPPSGKNLQPRKPPDPNPIIQTATNTPKPSMQQRKRRSTSPNSRDHRLAVTAKIPRNNGSQGTHTITQSLLEKLDSRGLLKAQEPIPPNYEDVTMTNQPMNEPYPNTTEPTIPQKTNNPSLSNQFPNIQPNNTNTAENRDVNAGPTEIWFELDHEKTLNTGNLFHSGMFADTQSNTRNTIAPNHTPYNMSQSTMPKTTILQKNQHETTSTQTNSNPNLTATYRSYANVTSYTSTRSKAQLQYFPPTNIENTQSPVIIPIQLCEQANEKHANTLFGYFIGATSNGTKNQ
ncbi:hypothetical protein LXL04_028982 [Taraxacum kok-saghyz]